MLKFKLRSLGLLLCVGLSGCQLFPRALPVPAEAPQQSEAYQPQFAKSATEAAQALAQARTQQRWPAFTAAVSWRGDLVWAAASGYADLERQAPATIETQFRVGSTSKAVTATAMARAVTRSELTMDTPIGQYKADLPNPAWQAMTLRQLMSHTAGMPAYAENTDWSGKLQSWLKWRRYTDVNEALGLFDDARLLSAPGQRFHYSSFGTVLASAVLQSATAQPFLSYLHAQVSEPLGLSSLAAAEQPHEQQARFYETRGGVARLHRPVDLSQKWAGGGLAASSVDLAKLGAAWLRPSFIATPVRQDFWTPQRLADGRENEQSYALGWRHSNLQHLYCDRAHPLQSAVSYVHHGGVSDGAQSLLIIYPQWDLVVAANINTQTADWCDFAREVSQLTKPFLRQLAPDLLN
ncbi:serine hydrolase domain-containing protein [Paucibacter sp. B51]|uniref:serine hydrolase domain-containing protein n=1 Tax=Paucibacter sp. B51 TaxID=2993315 RepID=UPI0022EC08FB|nr:serine hydrolase domain-containing protein [Paucibacter sp. B51]